VRGSRTPVILAEDQVYEPDILFVSRERADMIQPHGVVGAPDLVVEILSRGTVAYDRGPKFRGYERAGVRELWLVDPHGPAGTEFYRLEGDRFVPIVPREGVLESVTVAGFALQVTWLWPEERFVAVREALAWLNARDR